jgi:hypothetical protein
MRSTFTLFVFTLVLIATGLLVYSALGIARNSDDPAAGAVVTDFARALRSKDGKAACALLSPSTQSKLEDERKKPCAEAIVEVASDIEPHGSVAKVSVAESEGFVESSGGTSFFVDKEGASWKVSAAGCSAQAGDAPYSCQLEGG